MSDASSPTGTHSPPSTNASSVAPHHHPNLPNGGASGLGVSDSYFPSAPVVPAPVPTHTTTTTNNNNGSTTGTTSSSRSGSIASSGGAARLADPNFHGTHPLPALSRAFPKPEGDLDIGEQLAKKPLPRSLRHSIQRAGMTAESSGEEEEEKRKKMKMRREEEAAERLEAVKREWRGWRD